MEGIPIGSTFFCEIFFHLFRAVCLLSHHIKCVLSLWVEVKFEEHSFWCDPPTLRWGGKEAVLWWFTRSIVSKYCDIMDGSPPGSSVHGISQARILERVAISFSKESSLPRNWTQVSCSAGGFFSDWATSRGVKLKTGWPAQQFVTPQGVALFWFYPCPTDHLANVIVFFSTVRQEIISWR